MVTLMVNNLVEKMNQSTEHIGREKLNSTSYQLDNISKDNLLISLENLIIQSQRHKSALHVSLYLLNGGIAGLEYTETKKIKKTLDPPP